MHISCQIKAPGSSGGMGIRRLGGLFVSETETVRFWTGNGYAPEYSSDWLALETGERIYDVLLITHLSFFVNTLELLQMW